MLSITKNREGGAMTLALSGRLDATTSGELEDIIKNELDGISDLTLDLDGLEYVSSAGLRVFLISQKKMNIQGKMTVMNVSGNVSDVFDLTGFSELLTII